MTLDQLKKELRTASYETAVETLTQYIADNPDDDEALTARGMRHWGAGKRSLAINDYLAAIEINPFARQLKYSITATKTSIIRNTTSYFLRSCFRRPLSTR